MKYAYATTHVIAALGVFLLGWQSAVHIASMAMPLSSYSHWDWQCAFWALWATPTLLRRALETLST